MRRPVAGPSVSGHGALYAVPLNRELVISAALTA